MIQIQNGAAADSRTMTGEPNKEELLTASRSHIEDVRKGCEFFADMLVEAGTRHDHTKIEHIDEFFSDYASDLAGASFKSAKWYSERHLNERHHLTDKCPDDVTLIDVLERIIDITMAGMARSGSVFSGTISSEILQAAYTNTVKLLQSNIELK